MLRDKDIEDKKQKVLEDKKNELLEMARLVIPEEAKCDETNKDEDFQVKQLAKIQRKLDIYAHTHKQEIEKLRQQVEELGEIEKTPEKKDQLLKNINDIQTKYKIFGRYIQDEDFEQLFKVKFDILTVDINKQKESPLKDVTDKKEQEYYMRIIEEKVQEIIQGTNPYLKRAFGPDYLKSAVTIIKKLLKNGQRTFEVQEIMNDRVRLSLIVAFDKANGLDSLRFDKEQVDIELYEDICEWEDNISLKTIDQLREIEKIPITDEENLYIKLYHMHKTYCPKNYIPPLTFFLPEEIIKLKTIESWTRKSRYSHFAHMLRNSETIILPPRLKSIEEGVFDGCDALHNIKFKEGLEEIGDDAFFGCWNLGRIKPVQLPSSLKKIGNRAFGNCFNLHIDLNEGLREIGDYAFNFDNYSDFREFSSGYQKEFKLPASIEHVGKDIVNPRAAKVVRTVKPKISEMGELEL